jgi:ABC-type Zn uptake system ZnuABC Zn-binding protein ZnuA
MTEAVAGNLATVRSILPPGVDAHDFEPKPSDVQAISESALVLKNGIGLDDWVDKVIVNAGGERPLVQVTEGIALREASEHKGEAAGETSTGLDPHVWLSAANAMTMTRNIRDALAAVDPANTSTYGENADAYLAKLTELDKYISDQVATIPTGERKIVTNHDAFGYFIERYGLSYAGSIIPSMSSEAQPSAQDIAKLIERIKEEKVRVIFLESSINPSLARQIGNDTGAKVVDTLYGDSLGEPGSPGATYEGMMRYDADTIVSALK